MRILKAIRNDMRFQLKYGFYLLYLIISLVYIGIILALPPTVRGIASAVVVFSDPAALGMFFMGGIVLFEKSERVLNSLFISPLKIDEYILAKVVSLSLISTVVGTVIVLLTTPSKINFLPFHLGLFLGSILFSLVGLIVATKINSLNQFIIGIIPLSTVVSMPPFLTFFGFDNIFLRLHPGVIVLELILHGVQEGHATLDSALILCLWIAVFWFWARVNVKKMINYLGGIKI